MTNVHLFCNIYARIVYNGWNYFFEQEAAYQEQWDALEKK